MANYWWTAAAAKKADEKVSMLAVSRSRRDSALLLSTMTLRSGTKQPHYLGDGTHSLGTSLPEHQLLVTVQILWRFDEAEVDRSLVPRPQAVSVHGQDGGCLPYAATVD